jgi:hypothetical protein
MLYNSMMETTITRFRKEIFEFASEALEGKDVSFTYKGKRLKVVPEENPVHWLDRLTPMNLINEQYVEPAISLQQEMEAEWEKDWADL